jgi:hypothetical protein
MQHICDSVFGHLSTHATPGYNHNNFNNSFNRIIRIHSYFSFKLFSTQM